jgi:hypothetical protein
MRERVFEVLRLQTMLFGILSIFTLYRMSKLLKISTHLTLILFTFTPIWLMLSGYFKYDIALMFWIILSLYFFLRFAKDSTTKNFMLASIPASLAIAVKVSAAPLFLIYILLYFMFYPSWKKHFKQLAIGILLFISCIIIFGLPDTLFNKGNVLLYLNENIIQSPAMTSNFNLNMDPYQYLIFHHYPIIFGYGLCILFVVAILFWVYLLFRNIISKSLYINKIVLFTFLSFALFAISLIPLQIWAAGNRSLVLLPFFVLIVGLAYQRYKTIFGTNILLYIFIGIMILFQLFISAAWVDTRYAESPQVASSEWIRKNLPKGQTIGIENIPIYQQLPDILQKEFYFDQYKIKQNNLFTYVVIDEKTKKLPYIIVLTNADINKTLLKESSQKKLLRRLEEEKFKKIAVFSPKLTYLYTFINDQDYYFSALLASPRTITVYRKP